MSRVTPRLRVSVIGLLTAATIIAVPLYGQAPAAGGHQMGTAPAGCADASLRCAVAVTPAFAPDGSLWIVWAAGGQISVAQSRDGGRTFGASIAVTPTPLTLDSGADQRPQIVVDPRGRIIVAFAIFKDAKYNGQIFTATSSDGGRSFSRPTPITPDGSSQRFISLLLDRDGQVFASWIDKRRGAAAQQAGRPFAGASLAFAWSSDGGATFADARIAHDHMCECCRLGVALAGPHQPVVLFRNIFAGERDHAVLTFAADGMPGTPRRVAEDHWQIDACPHHGPSLAVGAGGSYHAVWFTGGSARQGAFYARSLDGGRTFSAPLALGRRPTRPYVGVTGDAVWVVWKEFDGERTTVRAMVSRDDGGTFSAPTSIATTDDFSDHPLLLHDGRRLFLSWYTRTDGYMLRPLETTS